MRELNTKISIIISIAIGALCVPVSQWIYNIVANFDIEHRFIHWITIVPEEYRFPAAMTHSFMVEMIAAIPIITIAGIVLGYLVKRNAMLFGCIAVSAFFVCDTIYCSILSGQFIYSRYAGTIWYTVVSTIAWILLFIIMTRVGISKVKKLQKGLGIQHGK